MAELSEIEKYIISKVKEMRIKNRLSQEKLSLRMGLSHSFVGNVESPKQPDKYNINHLSIQKLY